MFTRFYQLIMVFLLMLWADIGNAALVNYGNGLVYDSDKDITWYDFSYSATSWQDAVSWVESLSVISPVTGVSQSNWRLPETVDGLYEVTFDGSTTAGFNVSTSEMGHLFYDELGNIGEYGIDGVLNQFNIGLKNTGEFSNLLNGFYVSGTKHEFNTFGAPTVWYFRFDTGLQSLEFLDDSFFALAVSDGNINAVPLPLTFWLFFSGLIILVRYRV